MKNRQSRLEERLARILGATRRHLAPGSPLKSTMDLVYLSDDEEDRLNGLLP